MTERHGHLRPGEMAIDSVTGVEVSLPIAGAGGRSYAFIIDWHVRLLGALAWWLAASFIYNRGFTLGGSGGSHFMGVLLPAMLIYFLYHPVLEIAMHGRTPGKRIAGVRIVTREGATPGIGAILIRNLFRLIDSLPVFYCLGLAVTLFSSQHVRIGDLAAGTLLVYDRGRGLASSDSFAVASSGLDARLAELVDDLLRRWTELTPAARITLGRTILRRADPGAAEAAGEAAIFERLQSLLSERRR